MITDRLTAKLVGLLLFVMPLIITVSCFVFTKPELRTQPVFILVVCAPVIPLFALGARIYRKANTLPE